MVLDISVLYPVFGKNALMLTFLSCACLALALPIFCRILALLSVYLKAGRGFVT